MAIVKNEQYKVSVIIVLVFPLLPLLFEIISIHNFLDSSLALIASIYSFSVYSTSNKLSRILLGTIPGAGFAILYTTIIADQHNSILNLISDNLKSCDISLIQKHADHANKCFSHDWIIIGICFVAISCIAYNHNSERKLRHLDGEELFYTIQ